MRIVIDLQGAQSESRAGGVGRCSLALALGIARNAGDHEIWLILNGALPAIDELRAAFSGLVAADRIRVFDVAVPVAALDAANAVRARASELLREHVIAQLRPDAVLLTSLFEGFADDGVTSVGVLADARNTAVVLHDSALAEPETALTDPRQRDHWRRKIGSLERAGLLLSISDAARREALDVLELPAGRIVSIHAVDGDVTAVRALRALEAHAATVASERPTIAARPRLAFVSPLPPERTGIAGYAVQLLPALLEHFEIELVLQQSELDLPTELAALPRRSIEWFSAHAGEFEQVLYQFGNSPFHSHMFALLQRHPGVVMMHDFFVSHALAHEQLTGAMPGIWSEALFHSHGYPGLRAGLSADRVAAMLEYPCNLAVLQAAARVIVHSEHALAQARAWYGATLGDNWHVVPLPRSAPPHEDRAAARAALGIAPDRFVVCSFGFLGSTKLSDELVRAWLASALHSDPTCELVLVGESYGDEYGARLAALIAAPGTRIRITGWTDDAVYRRYLQAADAAVQLRTSSRGETSAAVLDCMNYGVATIVNANGSMATLPDDAVLKLPDAFGRGELVSALEALRGDSGLRAALGARARELIATRHRPASAAAHYARVLRQAAADAGTSRAALTRRLAAIPGLGDDQATLRQLASAIARAPAPLVQRQLLIDVSVLATRDLKTGIERVVRTQLLELLRMRVPGLRIEPVYLSDGGGHWHCRYARRYARELLGLELQDERDRVADVGHGDIYYGADWSPDIVVRAAAAGLFASWRARGVSVNFVLYDLLPVLQPQFFPAGADETHAAWLSTIATEADRLICISDTVALEMQAWLDVHAPRRLSALKLAPLHLGADIGGGAGAPINASALSAFEAIGARPTFLMVGTVEPRKGHLQALAAFELLWQRGLGINLVIVGGEGWRGGLPDHERRTIPKIVERLRGHAELNRHLFWLEGAADGELQRLYDASTCLLAASDGEGFGLPLIEAAHHGLPVLARDLPVFREVAQHSATYFSGMLPADLAAAVESWLTSYEQGAAPASTSMRSLTWQHNVQALLAVLDGRGFERTWPRTARLTERMTC